MKTIDMTGKRVGMLVVQRRIGSKGGQTLWECKCDCGNVCEQYGGNLRQAKIKSCGCYYKASRSAVARVSIAKEKHGASRSRLYYMWTSMKGRCYVKSNPSYPNYGGRGICVCDEWKNDFASFRDWAMSHGYDPTAKRGDCTIDRIDPNGMYCPENCRWVSVREQANNRRNSYTITYNGETHSASEWAEITGIPRCLIYSRYKAGHSPEEILTNGRLRAKHNLNEKRWAD